MEEKFHGLKAGLEIHQQLDTNKLFCNCPSNLRNDEPLFKVERKLNPVVGETGKIDTAAAHEKTKNKTFIYEVYDTNCLVELDEEPPHDINQEALKVALQIALLLNCKIFPVTQIMRKTVVDGSNTSGFQRTTLIAHDGFIETTDGKVGIETVAIEEDAARPAVKQEVDEAGFEHSKIYKLDRLGIPLVEITTKPDLKTPEQIKEAALKIGEILRSCKVKRGLGTIRQDVNISIKGTERVEIKGFQDPKMMIKTIETEMQRHLKLLEINEELKKRKAKGGNPEKLFDITGTLKNTECKFVKSSLDKGSKAIATKLDGFNKILGISFSDNKRFGTEVSDYAKVHGVGGMIHSDENLNKYNFSEKEIDEIKKILEIKKDDAFIIIVDEETKAREAIKSAIRRANLQIEKTSVKEVRKSNEDGSTTFLRPMPGEARMYPETDLKLLKISKELQENAKATLPKLISENKSYLEEFGLNDELVKNIMKQDRLEDFKYLLNTTKNAQLIAKCLTIFPKEIASKKNDDLDKVNIKLNVQLIESILQAVEHNKISEGDIKVVMLKIYEGEKLENALAKEKIDLTSEIKSLIKEKPKLSSNAYMGLIMAKFKGKVSGKEVADVIAELLK
ncbi:MAG: Glu-tRNA(Gln) amidotransferase subunit GatE [archaeon]